MNRDFNLTPRESRELPPEKLFSIMANIWGEDKAEELMEKLTEDAAGKSGEDEQA